MESLRRIDRRAFLCGALGIAALIRKSQNEVSHQSTPAFHEYAYDVLYAEQEPYQYCILTTHANGVDRAHAGESVRRTPLFEGDINEIRASRLNPHDFSVRGENPKNGRIMFVPVGYHDSSFIDAKFDRLSSQLEDMYKNVRVQFSYLKKSIPFSIQAIERMPSFTHPVEQAAFRQLIKNMVDVDAFIVVFNSSILAGSASIGGAFSLMSGESDYSIFEAGHELGHQLRLHDGNKRYYKSSTIPNTQLFPVDEEKRPLLRSDVEKIYEEAVNRPAHSSTGGFCLDKELYRFDFLTIMDTYAQTDRQMAVWENSGVPFFNTIQERLMNETVRIIYKK